MPTTIAHVTLLVRDYDEAIAWFTGTLDFEVRADTALGGAKRWVLVAPVDSRGTCLLLAKATQPEQVATIGHQAGGRVFLFLQTDDFSRDHGLLVSRGVRFIEKPRTEAYGTVAMFLDLYGNKWDLLELNDPGADHARSDVDAP